MHFKPQKIEGAYLVELLPHEDPRGSFTRTYCAEEFAGAGLPFKICQINVSMNPAAGTLRGLHYQLAPHAEGKIVRCTRGEIYDVVADLRPESSTYLQWEAFLFTPDTSHCLYVPPGCAHGFLTGAANSEVTYLMNAPYVPEAARGVRWNDSSLDIKWPTTPILVGERDANYPDLCLGGGK